MYLQDFPSDIAAEITSYITRLDDIFAASIAFSREKQKPSFNTIIDDLDRKIERYYHVHKSPMLAEIISNAKHFVSLSGRFIGNITINAASATLTSTHSLMHNITANNCDLLLNIEGRAGFINVDGSPKSLCIVNGIGLYVRRNFPDNRPVTLINCNIDIRFGPWGIPAESYNNVTKIACYNTNMGHKTWSVKSIISTLTSNYHKLVYIWAKSDETVEDLIAAINVIAALPEPPLCTRIITSHAAVLLAHFGRVHPLANATVLNGAIFKIQEML